MPYQQSDAIRDYVLPIVTVDREMRAMTSFLGTGFVIGERGSLLTAGHVLREHSIDTVMALVVDNDMTWQAVALLSVELHPSEDVAFARMGGGPWTSFLVLTDEWHGSSADYELWGYPAESSREVVVDNRAVLRPDLIYSAGHGRRRIEAGTLPSPLGGTAFELSTPAGPGTSPDRH